MVDFSGQLVDKGYDLQGYDLQLMSWGDGSGVPTSGNNLVIVGADNHGLIHIRIFDAGGNRVTDTDETKLPPTQAGAISTLKQELPGLLPPHVLTSAKKAQVISEVTSIVGQTLGQNEFKGGHDLLNVPIDFRLLRFRDE